MKQAWTPDARGPRDNRRGAPDSRPVLITIIGRQWLQDDPPSQIKVVTEGVCALENGETVLTYQESEASGLGQTKTTLTLHNDESVSMLREGDHAMRMDFRPGARHITNMTTPYGSLSMGLFTSAVSSTRDENGGRVRITYAMDAHMAKALNTKLDISYRYV
ncbi:MAG: DUF1934 domain-containing protein [Bacillota bacterium]|nr:DUF1934 domain-containing protein [Bacillota bacterium]